MILNAQKLISEIKIIICGIQKCHITQLLLTTFDQTKFNHMTFALFEVDINIIK